MSSPRERPLGPAPVPEALHAELEAAWHRGLGAVVASEDFPPLVRCEVLLRRKLRGLRGRLAQSFHQLLGSEAAPPRESFNRWLIQWADRHGRAGETTPAASCGGGEQGAAPDFGAGLYQELLAEVPMRVPSVYPADLTGQSERLRAFAAAAASWVVRRCPENTALHAACQSATEAGMADPRGAAKCFKALQEVLSPVVEDVEGPRIRRLCEELEVEVQSVLEAAKTCRRELLLSQAPDAAVEVGLDGHGHATLTAVLDAGVSGAVESVSVGEPCLHRLRELLHFSTARLKGPEASSLLRFCLGFESGRGGFWRLAFCVLCRYDAFCGPGKDEGQGLHAAVPPAVFRALAEHLGLVESLPPVECYASPLNCFSGGPVMPPGLFGSLFLDLDVFFGSLGSFLGPGFSACCREGLFEANPPFDWAAMQRCAARILRLLEESETARRSGGAGLCFAVFLPECQAPWLQRATEAAAAASEPATPLAALLASPYCRGSLVVILTTLSAPYEKSRSCGGSGTPSCTG